MPQSRQEGRAIVADGTGRLHQCGVVHLRIQWEAEVANLGDLLLCSLDEQKAIAAEKGGFRLLVHEKGRKVYRAGVPRSLFTRGEMVDAA